MAAGETFAARGSDEQIRLTATAANAAAATLGGAVIVPGIDKSSALLAWQALASPLGSVASHVLARSFLLLSRSEERH